MDPQQDPDTLELFKADMARRFFDSSTLDSQRELVIDRAIINLVEDGLVLILKTDSGWEFQLTEQGKSVT